MSSSKQYGLQIPKKNSHSMVKKHAAFGEDSDSDRSDGGTDWAKRALKTSEKNTVKRQTKIDMQRAQEQDSTVYQYDEVYDQIDKSKQDKQQRDKERKPKYIQKLLVTAEKRKIENERRVERQVQKEREAEGEEFKDKETFVTAAYKKKLEEFAKLDAEQTKQDMLEEIGDVTKQQDVSGFYRHLYQTTINGPQDELPVKSTPSKEGSSKKDDGQHQQSSRGNSHEASPSKHIVVKEGKDVRKKNTEEDRKKTTEEDKENDKMKKTEPKKDRQYRKRKESESSNKDADTDGETSSSSSSSSSDSESADEKSSHSETEDPKRIRSKEYLSSAETTAVAVDEIQITESPDTPQAENLQLIWEKRTVGPVFDAALKRYLDRKIARLTAAS